MFARGLVGAKGSWLIRFQVVLVDFFRGCSVLGLGVRFFGVFELEMLRREGFSSAAVLSLAEK